MNLPLLIQINSSDVEGWSARAIRRSADGALACGASRYEDAPPIQRRGTRLKISCIMRQRDGLPMPAMARLCVMTAGVVPNSPLMCSIASRTIAPVGAARPLVGLRRCHRLLV
ncbi:MAG: hypothetical protein KGJ75_10030 [Alphaproteobacteria bacterium]|nr:hypothetical protein [Alphaproteobacteria bacterium]MDE2352905.1 hypothetical protein [Alphaproteobacteria bacterium]